MSDEKRPWVKTVAVADTLKNANGGPVERVSLIHVEPQELGSIREHWEIATSGVFGGGLMARLSEFEEALDAFIRIAVSYDADVRWYFPEEALEMLDLIEQAGRDWRRDTAELTEELSKVSEATIDDIKETITNVMDVLSARRDAAGLSDDELEESVEFIGGAPEPEPIPEVETLPPDPDGVEEIEEPVNPGPFALVNLMRFIGDFDSIEELPKAARHGSFARVTTDLGSTGFWCIFAPPRSDGSGVGSWRSTDINGWHSFAQLMSQASVCEITKDYVRVSIKGSAFRAQTCLFSVGRDGGRDFFNIKELMPYIGTMRNIAEASNHVAKYGCREGSLMFDMSDRKWKLLKDSWRSLGWGDEVSLKTLMRETTIGAIWGKSLELNISAGARSKTYNVPRLDEDDSLPSVPVLNARVFRFGGSVDTPDKIDRCAAIGTMFYVARQGWRLMTPTGLKVLGVMMSVTSYETALKYVSVKLRSDNLMIVESYGSGTTVKTRWFVTDDYGEELRSGFSK